MNVNSRLELLYRNHWADLITNGSLVDLPKPTNPMLLKIDEAKYEAASLRIIICGQENWGWDPFGTSIEEGMQGYWDFFVKEKFYNGVNRSAYWKAFRYFKEEISRHFANINCYYIYQNISKIARHDNVTGVTPSIRSLERKYFPVFKSEIEILSPNIIIFLTGPNRDDDIIFHFKDASFKPTQYENNLRKLAQVVHNQLPACTFRTYHPAYYRGFTSKIRAQIISLISTWGEQGVAGYPPQGVGSPER